MEFLTNNSCRRAGELGWNIRDTGLSTDFCSVALSAALPLVLVWTALHVVFK